MDLKKLIFLLLTVVLGGCHEAPEYEDDPLGNFDALATIVKERYCFFQEKDIDWDDLCTRYRSLVTPQTKQLALFEICSQLLDELQDGHVNLTSRFNTSYYRNWWSDYPQDFNLRTLQQYYLDFDYMQTSGISYKMLTEEIGYMYYPSFSAGISELSLDYILAILHDSKGLIIDIRDNGGGLLTNINRLVGRFIAEKTIGGYIRHKTGPAPDAFSEPYPIEYEAADPAIRVKYLDKPIIVLTNRSCFSAANDFVAVMKELPNVTIVGARTGGGGGLPFSSELPNGWGIRFSACPINDSKDRTTEFGIDPSPGCEVHCTDEELAAGHDAILEFAVQLLSETTERRSCFSAAPHSKSSI
ncbi:MAG: S41 family peptidase [Muribaculaceae bacterium]|nr:S41 family peptidase [Muribaculaceae bacterium]